MSAVLYGDCESLAYIEVLQFENLLTKYSIIIPQDPTLMPVHTTTMKKDSVTGTGWECGMPTYCNWREDPYP